MGIEITSEIHARRTEIILGLSETDVESRKEHIGASDANIILGGDPERIVRLWQEKRGEIAPEDLSDILAVQMGTWTEAFNLLWFEKQTGHVVYGHKKKFTHPDTPFIVAAPDGLTDIGEAKTVIDAKHVGPFYFDMDAVVAKYMPQLATQMYCADASKAALSVFVGNSKWEHRIIERDALYEAQVLGALKRFWKHVQDGTPPVDMPTLIAPVPAAMRRTVSMINDVQFGAWERSWLDTQEPAKRHDEADKALKAYACDDIGEVRGTHLCVKVNANGRRISKIKK